MWLAFAFLSAFLLGFYDVAKKRALHDNAVMMVLLLNCLFSSLIFLPVACYAPFGGWEVQKWIILKAFIVLSSWICGYYAMANLPLTLVGPVNATRPVLVLIGAMLIFGERLNAWQWAGVITAMTGFYLLKLGGKKEGIDFLHNRWIFCLIIAALLGACSGLYDKFLLTPTNDGGLGLNRLTVQSYFNFYQLGIMTIICCIRLIPSHTNSHPSSQLRGRKGWSWRGSGLWYIPLISIFVCLADLAYFYCLSLDDAMISIVSMVRRGSVLVSFTVGAFFLHEKNIRSKAIDLALVLLSMILLYIGTK